MVSKARQTAVRQQSLAAPRLRLDPISGPAWLVAVLALVATAVGLFWQGGSAPATVTSVRGETVQLYGHGIYRYDSLFQGAIFRGADAAALVVGVPLLVLAMLWYRRGSLRGALVLTGMLAYFLYYYASVALSAAYNGMFLVYVALFSASLFAFVLSFRSIERHATEIRLSPGLPRRALAIFMLAAGAVTLVVWLSDVVAALLRGEAPAHLDGYTTPVTYALDLAIITPTCFVTGVLLLRRATMGYLLAVPLLGVIVLLAPTIVGQTVSQLWSGVSLTPPEIIGPTVGFVMLGLIASRLLVTLLRHIPDPGPTPAAVPPLTESDAK